MTRANVPNPNPLDLLPDDSASLHPNHFHAQQSCLAPRVGLRSVGIKCEPLCQHMEAHASVSERMQVDSAGGWRHRGSRARQADI